MFARYYNNCALSLRKIAIVLFAATFITACGSDDDDDSPPTSPPVENKAPTANAGTDATVNENTTATLTGTANDTDGEIASVIWKQVSGPDVTLTNANNATAEFVAPEVTADTKLTFSFEAKDDDDDSAQDTVVITVANVNKAPTANAGQDQTVFSGEEVTLSATATDPDDNIQSINWEQVSGPELTLANADQAQATFSAPTVLASDNLQLEFKATVSDSEALSASDNIVITVVQKNPDAVASAGIDRTGAVAQNFANPNSHELIFLDGSASSGSTFSWQVLTAPENSQYQLTSDSTPSTGFYADTAGEYQLQVSVDNGQGVTASDEVTITLIEDNDGDGIVDANDPDRDGDGFLNASDIFPDDKASHNDLNSDGIGNFYQTDVDNDGVIDVEDDFPLDAAKTLANLYSESTEPNGNNNNDGISVSENAGAVPIKVSGAIYSVSGPDLDYYQVTLDEGIYSAVLHADNPNMQASLTIISAAGAALPTTRTNFVSTSGTTGIGFSVPSAGNYYLIITDGNGNSGQDWTYRTDIFADTDMDGLSNDLEQAIDSNELSADSDGDSIPDYVEFQFVKTDWETNKDQDGDALPPWWDMDSDGDLIPDRVEFYTEDEKPALNAAQREQLNNADSDNAPNFVDISSDNTAFADDSEQAGENPIAPKDTDGDGVPDYIDLDNDNDGLKDNDESLTTYNVALMAPGAENLAIADSLLVTQVINTSKNIEDLCVAGDSLAVTMLNGPNNANQIQAVFNTLDGAELQTANAVTDNVAEFTCPDNLEAGLVEFYLAADGKRSGATPLQIKTLQLPILSEVSFDKQSRQVTLVGENLAAELNIEFKGASSVVDNAFGDQNTLTLDLPNNATSGYVSVTSAQGTSNMLWLSLSRSITGQIISPNPNVDMTKLDVSLLPTEEVMANADGSFNTDAAITKPTTITALRLNDGATEDNPAYSMYLASIVFPSQLTTELSVDSTAIALVWNGLGVEQLAPSNAYQAIYDSLASLEDVEALSAVLATELSTDPQAISAQNNAIMNALEAAMITASGTIANILDNNNFTQQNVSLQGLFGDPATVTPSEAQDIKVYEYDDSGDVAVENDSQLYLSVKITASDGTVLQNHISGLSGMAGPQGYGLLFWASTTQYKDPSGRNAIVEVISPGIRGDFNPVRIPARDVWIKLYFRTVVERIAWPILEEVLPLPEDDFVKILWNNAPGLVDIMVTKAIDGDVKGSVKSLIDLLWQDIASVPPGPITTALAKKMGKDAAEKILAKIAAKIGAKFVPGVGQIALAAEVAGYVNKGANVAKAIVDIGGTDSAIHFNVKFPLSIEAAQPSKVLADGTDKTFEVTGTGFTKIQRNWWPFEHYLEPRVTVIDQDNLRATVKVESISTDGQSMRITVPGWFLDENTNGPLDIEIHHPVDTPDAKVVKEDAIAITGQLELSSISPDSGGTGITATIYGTGFDTVLANNEVTIGGEKALIFAASESSVSVIIPTSLDSGVYDVIARVKQDGVWSDPSNSLKYEVVKGDVSITVCDNGGAKDDAFALYVDGLYTGTMYANNSDYCDTYNPELKVGVHSALLLGIEAPDSIGTYSISFTGVTNLSGSPRSGTDLTPGVKKTYSFEVVASQQAQGLLNKVIKATSQDDLRNSREKESSDNVDKK
ncbi:IPT/TIG domain-containing protein [Pseudoalteromonas piscicida]|uniref:IPT/TIG domain-containing protein n=1 Tax=Pseudoalteromonas piscicida TaxID=43662 RepID=UPI0030B0B722